MPPVPSHAQSSKPARPALRPLPPDVVARQNWILDPLQDGLLVIAAPLLSLALALVAFRFLPPDTATAWIIVTHIVFTVAHHVPTFIRIYGDVDLFRRFKWSFIFGPLIPFASAMGILSYLNLTNHPIEDFFYLLIILSLWDPWHFLMQHYGFMRIYDRLNRAPAKLAARMDWLVCATWFVFILLATGDWLPGVLEQLYLRVHVPLILDVPVDGLARLARVAGGVALATTVFYAGYVAWCWRNGYFVSTAKLALLAVTFGVMYLTYTPNPLILRLAPGWTFKVGFAVLGVVHVTQYMAIVWRYNRSLATRPDRSRPGLFRRLHARGGAGIAVLYVTLCLGYGEILTRRFEGARWLMAVLLAIGFTSTLMHYYFDGFIWKIRHQQNREALAMQEGMAPHASAAPALSKPTAAGAVLSWWTGSRELTPVTVFTRQLFYFGLPMLLLTAGAWWVWREPAPDYVSHMYRAYRLNKEGAPEATLQEARLAVADMERELPLFAKLAELQPTASHKTAYAYLLYDRSHYKRLVIPEIQGQPVGREQRLAHAEEVEKATALLKDALATGGSLSHPGREKITSKDAELTLDHWQDEVNKARWYDLGGSPAKQ